MRIQARSREVRRNGALAEGQGGLSPRRSRQARLPNTEKDREDRVPSRLAKFAAALLLVGTATAAVQAQDFPNRPIRMVIAFPPGGPTDFVGRLVADKVKDILGQSVIIENKAGANGALGADAVAKSAPDGYTLFLTTVGAVAITPHMRTDLPYDVLRDFAAVTLVVRNTTVVVVRADSPANSAKDLAAMAKAKPGEIAFASTGVGSTTHLALELFQTAAGVKFVHVPYRGAAPALTDLLGGQIQAFSGDVPVLIPQITAGKVKAIGAMRDCPMCRPWPSKAMSTPRRTIGTDCWRPP